jgi:hypothetical protein
VVLLPLANAVQNASGGEIPGVLPLDMVDNSSGLLERAPGRAGPAPARVSRTLIQRGHALILVTTRLIVGHCAGFAVASPVAIPRPRNCGFPSPHAEGELSTMSRGSTPVETTLIRLASQ